MQFRQSMGPVVALLVALLALTASHRSISPPPAASPAALVALTGASVMVGVGDIASCSQRLSFGTARLVDSVLRADSIAKVPNAVFTLGDNAYSSGTTAEFNQCFAPSWGDPQKGIIKSLHPSPGNHEYQTLNAAPYYKYFGSTAGDEGKGYYSYDVGARHVVVVNSEIIVSSAYGFLAAGADGLGGKDLKAHKKLCTIAYWHNPRFARVARQRPPVHSDVADSLRQRRGSRVERPRS
jgi:hypothetical protein